MLDGLVAREVLRRGNTQIVDWNDNSPGEITEKDIALMQSVLRWKVSKFMSFEFLDHMDEDNGAFVPQDLRDEYEARTKRESMYIQPIHD